ncbi:hypothetical protein EMPG_10569 [Blastomyces silverae]|uniref:Uncharacterized protein n=1 Tax=Blastomyces silverae TaxID=2060906 RepID=A0A0H1B9T7_9EURO|nr:hypothetical protein EMPG_10569 [Blastomyces silverae]
MNMLNQDNPANEIAEITAYFTHLQETGFSEADAAKITHKLINAKDSRGGEDLSFSEHSKPPTVTSSRPHSEHSKPTQAAKDPYIQCSYCKYHQHVEANCQLKNWKDQSAE